MAHLHFTLAGFGALGAFDPTTVHPDLLVRGGSRPADPWYGGDHRALPAEYWQRQRLPGYTNRSGLPLVAVNATDARKWFNRNPAFASWSKEQHLAEAFRLHALAEQAQRAFAAAADSALATYGSHGALISGAVREHFPTDVKDQLRFLAHARSELDSAAFAHWYASGKRSRPDWTHDPWAGTGLKRPDGALRGLGALPRDHAKRWTFAANDDEAQAWRVKVFNLVAPKDNWKMPINTVVSSADLAAVGATVEDVVQAIGWFAGGGGGYRLAPGGYRVFGPGYYRMVGA